MKLIKLIGIILLVTMSLQARDVVDLKGTCKINWTMGYITCEGESAEGQNRYGAKLSAKIIAQKNLLEVVKGVQIDSLTTIKDGMFSSEVIQSRVSGIIRGAQLLSNTYNSTYKNSIAVVRLEMGKDLLSALLSDPTQLSWNEKVDKLWSSFSIMTNAEAATYNVKDKETIKRILEDLRKRGDELGSKYLTTVLNDLETTTYSGILIDVSEVVNFKKAMIVKLVDKNGKEIYPADIVSKKTLLKRNTSVGFMYGFDDARNNKRVFHIPMEMKAKSVYKKRYSNIVLSQEQIDKIQTLDRSVLKKAKIILVLGE
ncbi:hypothetical protein JHD47_06640 [Sulfurimonas sp. SAG-AH-194-L11]|nr:hypothetical protein [Sulfurimonas sp. SAG-AH-194-L11]MDF1877491.1 hypothetical protein [Sulfurimonas sp. SAG-AH-194-L11]